MHLDSSSKPAEIDEEAEKTFETDMKGFLNKHAEKEKAKEEARQKRAKQKAQEQKAQTDSREVPQYVITRTEHVQVVVNLPLVNSMKAVELDVAADTLRLASPEYLLECKLPCAVDASATSAKFKKSTKELVVITPSLSDLRSLRTWVLGQGALLLFSLSASSGCTGPEPALSAA